MDLTDLNDKQLLKAYDKAAKKYLMKFITEPNSGKEMYMILEEINRRRTADEWHPNTRVNARTL